MGDLGHVVNLAQGGSVTNSASPSSITRPGIFLVVIQTAL